MEKQYNFNIIFEKLDEIKSEQNLIDNSDFIISEQINEQIKEIKDFCDNSSNTEIEIYTRT